MHHIYFSIHPLRFFTFGYCEQYCCNHLCTDFCVDICFAYLGVELLSYMVTSWLTLEEFPDCFPKHTYHFTVPAEMYEGSDFSTSSPTLIIVGLLTHTHPSGCDVVSHRGVDCISLMVNNIQHLFMCFSAICMYT